MKLGHKSLIMSLTKLMMILLHNLQFLSSVKGDDGADNESENLIIIG